jgi:hypothetical protein
MPGLQTVYQLQVADLERAEAARRLREAEEGLGETEELRRARERLQGEETALTRLRTRVRDLELELQGLTTKIASNEERLYGGDVRNPKELESLQADLVHLRHRRDTLEDKILTGLTESDESEERLKRARSEWETAHSAWEREQERLAAVIADLRSQLTRLDERIESLRGALPADLLEAYDDACRRKGGRGVAAIRGGLCEGCRVAVPTSLVQQLRRGDHIVRCGSCGRILCVAE